MRSPVPAGKFLRSSWTPRTPTKASRAALVTLGIASGAGVELGEKLHVSPRVGQSYTFAAFLKGVGGPITGSPGNRAGRLAVGQGRQGPGSPRAGGPVDRFARHLRLPQAFPRRLAGRTSPRPRKAAASAPTCSGSMRASMFHGILPGRRPSRPLPRARRTSSSTPASRAAGSPGSSCSTNSST